MLAVQESPLNSARQTAKVSPWLCLLSLVAIAATFLYNKLYIGAVLLAPFMGLLAFAALVVYWRTGKAWASTSVAAIFFTVSVTSSDAGLLWGVPQSLAFALLFMSLPLLLFQRHILRWLAQVHG